MKFRKVQFRNDTLVLEYESISYLLEHTLIYILTIFLFPKI